MRLSHVPATGFVLMVLFGGERRKSTKGTGKLRRRRRRRRYVRNSIIYAIVILFVGIGIGFGCGWFAGNSNQAKGKIDQYDLSTDTFETVDSQTAVTIFTQLSTVQAVNPSIADAKGIPWGTKENPFRIGNAYSLMAETTATGEAHDDPATTPFVSQNLSVALVDFYTPEHYEYFHGNEYRLFGTEAAVVLRISADKPCNP